jgi:FemAB-related protein (PEP-CTERM system-associated)
VKLDAVELPSMTPSGAPAIRLAGPGDAARWDAFVERCPEATFFHRFGWKEVIETAFRHRAFYLLAERDAAIVGVLPLAEVKTRLFGHSLASLPFCVYGGVAATDAAAVPALHAAARALADELDADHLELRNRVAREPGWPRQDLYVTFRREILPEVEANLLAIPRKQRAMVRKGIQRGLRSELDASVDRFFALYADNVHRHGTPAQSKRYFATLQRVFGKDAEVLTVLAADGKPVSSVLSFYFRDEVLPYYAGDAVAARELAANDFKYWELMRRACERGLRVFDYGRSKRGTGSFDFKKNWGFEPDPLHYEYVLRRGDSVPQHNPSNAKYKATIAVWRRLPLPLANALGPYIVRGLG